MHLQLMTFCSKYISNIVILIAQVLDREEKEFYTIYIKAQDEGIDPKPLSSVVPVNITIEDVNDNKPVFSQSQYFVSLPEDTKVNTVVLNVTATDADAGLNGKIEYQPLDLYEFSIDRQTGAIRLRQELDYDVYHGEYEFVVVVFDHGAHPKLANVEVKVSTKSYMSYVHGYRYGSPYSQFLTRAET